jgi:hypothetical protein
MRIVVCLFSVTFFVFAKSFCYQDAYKRQNEKEPVCWSKGVPIWQIGDALPKEGYTLLSICARKAGIYVNDPTSNEIYRELTERWGHVWLEMVDSLGNERSIAGNIMGVSKDDITRHKFDLDTIRLGYLVSDEEAYIAEQAVIAYASKGYNLLLHNCVGAAAMGAGEVCVDEFFYKIHPSYFDDESSFLEAGVLLPNTIYYALDAKINELNGTEFTPEPTGETSAHRLKLQKMPFRQILSFLLITYVTGT